MISMPVGYEDVINFHEADSRFHQLPLSTFATVEQENVPLICEIFEYYGRMMPVKARDSRYCTEKDHV